MTVTGALSPFGKRGEMSPHKRASGKRLRPTIQIENDKGRYHGRRTESAVRGIGSTSQEGIYRDRKRIDL